MHEAYAHGESRTPLPPSFSTQKNRCPSEYAHGSLRSLIYIYIYITPRKYIYIYIYFKKISMRHVLAFLKKAEKTQFSFANFSMKVSDNLPSVNEKVVALCL